MKNPSSREEVYVSKDVVLLIYLNTIISQHSCICFRVVAGIVTCSDTVVAAKPSV